MICNLGIKQWKKGAFLSAVLISGYFASMIFSSYTQLNFNFDMLKFVVLLIIFLLAIVKVLVQKYKHILISKNSLYIVFTILFGFFNGLGSYVDFKTNIGVLDGKLIPVFEVILGYSIAIIFIVLAIFFINILVLRVLKFNKLKWDKSIAFVVSAIIIPMLISQIIY